MHLSNPLMRRFRLPNLLSWKISLPNPVRRSLCKSKFGLLDAAAVCALAIYLIACALTFDSWVEPTLRGSSEWRIAADSTVYMGVADHIRERGSGGAIVGLLALSRNLILPALVAVALKTDERIAVFNIVIFFVALYALARTFPQFRWYVFLPIVLASPTTYEALLTLNKELFVFLCAAVMARWFQTKSSILMIGLLLLSMALRWEQALVIICFSVLLSMKVRPVHAAVLMIIGISIAYPFAIPSVDVGADVTKSSSSAFYAEINALQSYGLYFILLVPKAIIALLSHVVRFWTLFADPARLHDLPTGLFVLVDQLCMCFVIVAAWRKKLWKLENPVVYFVLVYCVIFFAAPENSPRYLYMLFVLMTALLASPELQSLRISRNQR